MGRAVDVRPEVHGRRAVGVPRRREGEDPRGVAEDLTEGHAAEAEAGAGPLTSQPDAPGWHPDPFGRLPFRWWDGTAWTAYAADTAVRWDAEPLEVVEPQQPGLPGFV